MTPLTPPQNCPPGHPETKIHRAALAMAAVCLILAVVHFHAYWPYQLSRWGLCYGAVVLLLRSSGWRQIAFGIIAVIYNPIEPLAFRDLWPLVNALTVIALLGTLPRAIWREVPRLGKIGASWLVVAFLVGGLAAAAAAAILAFFRADDPLLLVGCIVGFGGALLVFGLLVAGAGKAFNRISDFVLDPARAGQSKTKLVITASTVAAAFGGLGYYAGGPFWGAVAFIAVLFIFALTSPVSAREAGNP